MHILDTHQLSVPCACFLQIEHRCEFINSIFIIHQLTYIGFANALSACFENGHRNTSWCPANLLLRVVGVDIIIV